MLRLLAILALMPPPAAADWAPRPLMFDYAATLDVCAANPDEANLAMLCADALAHSYTLKRAVALAAFKCQPQDLAVCAAPFEDEGLPAISVRIATDVGCDATDVMALDDGPLPTDHCITIASDIMIDEGVVPLFTDISCGFDWIECGELAQINAAFWVDQVDATAPGDPTVSNLTLRNIDDCNAAALDDGWAIDLNALECLADRLTALWADLAITQAQEN
jgi:hypothetical protein